jgi:toxin ParE1/3/4
MTIASAGRKVQAGPGLSLERCQDAVAAAERLLHLARASVRKSVDAAGDLENIKAYIGREDGVAAARVVEQIRGIIRLLAEWPHLGRAGIVAGTYERSVPRTPYVVVYRIDLGTLDELIVLRVPHAAQDRSRYDY